MRKAAIILLATIFLSGAPKAEPITIIEPPVQAIHREHKTFDKALESPVAVVFAENNTIVIEPDEPEDLPIEYTEQDLRDIMALAQMANGEYNLIDTPEHKMQCAAVMWCAYWRSRQGASEGFKPTVESVCAQPYQFLGYNPNAAVSEDLRLFAEDVFYRCKQYEIVGSYEAVGCVLPKEYLWFYGTGYVNVFRDRYQGGKVWDWSLPNPYE